MFKLFNPAALVTSHVGGRVFDKIRDWVLVAAKPHIVALALILLPASASAEMEKTALVCPEQLCLYWWPRLPAIEGWHQDREQSYKIAANALAPDGSDFSKAETVMYVKASYKPKIPDTKSLEMFISDDLKSFSKDSNTTVAEVTELVTADGKRLKSFTFFPVNSGNWERVAYGEEGDFYLVFTLSSRTEAGYKKALAAYEALVRGYREKPSGSSERMRVE
jgi:hypothetical protein